MEVVMSLWIFGITTPPAGPGVMDCRFIWTDNLLAQQRILLAEVRQLYRVIDTILCYVWLNEEL